MIIILSFQSVDILVLNNKIHFPYNKSSHHKSASIIWSVCRSDMGKSILAESDVIQLSFKLWCVLVNKWTEINYMLFFNITERVFWACSFFVYLNVFDHTGRKTGSERAITEYVFKSSSLFYHNQFQILTLGYFDTDSEIFKLHSPTVSYKLQYVSLQRSSKPLSRHLLARKSISTPCCFIYSIWV